MICKGQDLQNMKLQLKSMSIDDWDLISTVHRILEIEPFYENAHERLSSYYRQSGKEKSLESILINLELTIPILLKPSFFPQFMGTKVWGIA